MQRLRLLYSTPSKNWFNATSANDMRLNDGVGKSSKWRLRRQDTNWIDRSKTKEDYQKQLQFDVLMSYQDDVFYDISEGSCYHLSLNLWICLIDVFIACDYYVLLRC